jgi:hypothetical protein
MKVTSYEASKIDVLSAPENKPHKDNEPLGRDGEMNVYTIGSRPGAQAQPKNPDARRVYEKPKGKKLDWKNVKQKRTKQITDDQLSVKDIFAVFKPGENVKLDAIPELVYKKDGSIDPTKISLDVHKEAYKDVGGYFVGHPYKDTFIVSVTPEQFIDFKQHVGRPVRGVVQIQSSMDAGDSLSQVYSAKILTWKPNSRAIEPFELGMDPYDLADMYGDYSSFSSYAYLDATYDSYDAESQTITVFLGSHSIDIREVNPRDFPEKLNRGDRVRMGVWYSLYEEESYWSLKPSEIYHLD